MKSSAVGILILLALCSVCAAQDRPALEETERINYSVGYQIGGDFEHQEIELDPGMLVRGIEDALSKAEPLMEPQEMRDTLVELKKKISATLRERQKAAADENLAEGRIFLKKNGERAGVTILPSGLQYQVLEEGEGEPPEASDTVTMHYRGTLIDGSEFDSSYARNQPATFVADHAIKGWKEALKLMRPGAKYRLFVSPELAYGRLGAGGKIGPNSTLIFEVKLLSVQRAEKTSSGNSGKAGDSP